MTAAEKAKLVLDKSIHEHCKVHIAHERELRDVIRDQTRVIGLLRDAITGWRKGVDSTGRWCWCNNSVKHESWCDEAWKAVKETLTESV